jgi:hypothetical protein
LTMDQSVNRCSLSVETFDSAGSNGPDGGGLMLLEVDLVMDSGAGPED